MLHNIKQMGPLRNLLHGTALLLTLLMPFAQEPNYASDNWNLFFGSILPAIAPIVVIVIMQDILLSHIWKSDADEIRITHLNKIIKLHLLIGGLLLAAWLAIFLPRLW